VNQLRFNNSSDVNYDPRPPKNSTEIQNKNRSNSKNTQKEQLQQQSSMKSPKDFKFELKSVLSLSKEDQIELFNQFDIDSSGDLD